MFYFAKRLFLTALSLFFFTWVSFFLIHFLPGGPLESKAALVENRGAISIPAEILNQYGWDRPLGERYWLWLSKLLKWDLGQSYYYQEPVILVMKRFLIPSLILNSLAFFFLYSLALPLGMLMSVFKDSPVIKGLRMGLVVLHSFPHFLLSFFLLWVFVLTLDWFPLPGMNGAAVYVLPVFVMVMGGLASASFYFRTAVTEELRRPYVSTLYVRGVARSRILLVHVLRNVGVSCISHLEDSLAFFFSGTLIVETIFGIQGIGKLAYDSLLRRDYPVMLAVLLLFGFVGVISNLLGDLLYRLVDPRVRLS